MDLNYETALLELYVCLSVFRNYSNVYVQHKPNTCISNICTNGNCIGNPHSNRSER